MPRGGYHPNAERWGRKSAWQNESPTKTIRVPEALIERILDYAHKLDIGEFIDYDTKAKESNLNSKSTHKPIEQEQTQSIDAYEQEIKDLKRDLEETQLELQKTRSLLKVQPIASRETIELLEAAITPKSKGGNYSANNATGLKSVVEQALKQLKGDRKERS